MGERHQIGTAVAQPVQRSDVDRVMSQVFERVGQRAADASQASDRRQVIEAPGGPRLEGGPGRDSFRPEPGCLRQTAARQLHLGQLRRKLAEAEPVQAEYGTPVDGDFPCEIVDRLSAIADQQALVRGSVRGHESVRSLDTGCGCRRDNDRQCVTGGMI